MSSFASESREFTYHPDSPYYGKPGYWGGLTDKEKDVLKSLHDKLKDRTFELEDLCLSALNWDLILLRYLRANKFDVDKAYAHILKNVEWRKDNNIKELVSMDPDEILGINVREVLKFAPHWHRGFDKCGRPIIYKHYGATFNATHVKDLIGAGTLEPMERYHIWEMEACVRLAYEQSLRTGHIVETISAVVDLQDLSLWNINGDMYTLIKSLADVDQQQFPETLGYTVVINTSMVFPALWRIIREWIDPVPASKIHIAAGREQWLPLLSELFGSENLSSSYGGHCPLPPLDPSQHPYAAISCERELLLPLSVAAAAVAVAEGGADSSAATVSPQRNTTIKDRMDTDRAVNT
jgi:hypothetical protein